MNNVHSKPATSADKQQIRGVHCFLEGARGRERRECIHIAIYKVHSFILSNVQYQFRNLVNLCANLKGVFAKNEREYRLNAIKKRF